MPCDCSGYEEYIFNIFERGRKESEDRSKRIMRHYGCEAALILSRAEHQKVYPEVPFDNPTSALDDC